MSRPRAGFTLIEILVSIGIFAVAALVMLGTLLTASEVFRRGESARQAGDEATAVLAALRDDLARAVPVRLRDGVPAPEWGRLYTDVAGPARSCRLAFVIENPDRTAVKQDGTLSRLWVAWFVDVVDATDPSTDELRRVTAPWTAGSGPPAMTSGTGEVVTRGCLHFGVWVDLAELHRPVTAVDGSPLVDWETDQPPRAGGPYDTRGVPDAALYGVMPFWPAADALRISIVLTGGGRYAARGTLASGLAATDTDARIAGIKALSTISGSALRVGDEWIGYDNLRGGQVTGLERGTLRSSPSGHAARTLVLAGQPFSLVVALPR
jgi:prepilin-type N-terminal cleavage/methylation domain-containing protein